MSLNRSIQSALVLVILGSGGSWSRGADSAALSALKAKGLSKSSHTFVLEAEKPVLDKMKEVRTAFANYATLAERQALAEQVGLRLTEMEGRRVELQDNLNDLNQRIVEQASNLQGNNQGQGQGRPGSASSPQRGFMNEMIANRDQMKSTLAEITLEQKNIKEQGTQVKDRKSLDDDVMKKGDVFKTALAELRPLVDEVTKKYAELGLDESVKKAISDLEKESKADFKLGPSDAFLAGVKALDQAERRFLGKKTMATTTKKKAKSRK